MAREIEITVKVDAKALQEKLGDLAEAKLREALADGLAEAGQYLQGAITIAGHQKLAQRTGMLLESVRVSKIEGDALTLMVGVPADSPAWKYAWLLTGAKFPIRPLKGEYLALPVGRALTAAGVPRYRGPRDLGDALVWKRGAPVAVPWMSEPFMGLSAGVEETLPGGDEQASGAYIPLFVFLRGVTAVGRNVIDPAIETSFRDMVETVQEHVDKLLAA